MATIPVDEANVDRRKFSLDLFALREVLAASSDDCLIAATRSIPADALRTSLLRPSIKALLANVVRKVRHVGGVTADEADDILRVLFEEVPRQEIVNRCLGERAVSLAHSSDIEDLIAKDLRYPIFSDAGFVAHAVDDAARSLASVSPRLLSLVQENVRAVVGIDAPTNIMHSCSTDDWPGLIAVAIGSGTLATAEALVHEATHIALNNDISAGKFDFLRALPAVLSPFTDTVRPAVRVVHGLVAYSAVLELWSAVELNSLLAGSGTQLDAAVVRRRRLARIASFVAVASRRILQLLQPAQLAEWEQLCSTYCQHPSKEAGTLRIPSSSKLKLGLNLVELAELKLAMAGAKCSRIMLTQDRAKNVVSVVEDNEAGVCFSSYAVFSLPGNGLGHFSNVEGRALELIDPAATEAGIYAYIGHTPAEALSTFLHDQMGKAGKLFGIPECCEEAFSQRWGEARASHMGDVFGQSLSRLSHALIRAPWETNVAAMYFGVGLCWHFPCAFDCRATIEAVRTRHQILQGLDPQLARRLSLGQRRPIIWSPNIGYGQFAGNRVVWANEGSDPSITFAELEEIAATMADHDKLGACRVVVWH
jgi:hypothetical protein